MAQPVVPSLCFDDDELHFVLSTLTTTNRMVCEAKSLSEAVHRACGVVAQLTENKREDVLLLLSSAKTSSHLNRFAVLMAIGFHYRILGGSIAFKLPMETRNHHLSVATQLAGSFGMSSSEVSNQLQLINDYSSDVIAFHALADVTKRTWHPRVSEDV